MPKDKPETTEEALKVLMEQVKELPSDIQKGFTTALNNVQTQHSAAVKAAEEKAAADKANKADEVDEDFDVDRASRKDFGDYLLKRMVKEVNSVLKPLTDQITKTSDDATKSEFKQEISDIRAKYPDFDKFKDEMGAIHKESPNMRLVDLYDLAKARNPEKVAEVEKASNEQKDKDTGANSEIKFGGLFATNSGSKEDNDENKGKMDPKDAGKAAWDTVMSQVPEKILSDFLEG